jgi:hypothetical protein
MLLVLCLSAGRSFLHARCGRSLGHGDARAARTYVIAALLHTVAVVALIRGLVPISVGKLALVGGVALLSWPAVVALLAARAARGHDPQWVPAAADQGLTGLAILMAGLGSIGFMMTLIYGALAFQTAMAMRGFGLGGGAGLSMAIIGGLLLVFGARAFVPLRGGFGFLRTFDVEAFHEARERYFKMGVITCVVGLVAILVVGAIGGLFVVLLIGLPVVGLLMSWPFVVREASSVPLEAFNEDVGGIDPAPDAGLSTLGVVLIAGGVFTAVYLVVLQAVGVPFGGNTLAAPESTWRVAVTAALYLWVGVELLRATARVPLALYVYGALSLALAFWQVYVSWDVMGALMAAGAVPTGKAQAWLMILLPAAITLVLPALGLLQLRRQPPASALRRYAQAF